MIQILNLVSAIGSLTIMVLAIILYINVRRSISRQRKAMDEILEERRKLFRAGRIAELKENMKLNKYFNQN